MENSHFLLLGVKNTVIAFNKRTGEEIWRSSLNGHFGDFVSLLSDEERVYAHAGGELYCLDLETGKTLWHNGLAGMGYGVAGLSLAGNAKSTSSGAYQVHRQSQDGTACSG